MDQVKIGKFIAECRKKQNLTQMQLAEKLELTDRAVSKWENGKAMPDSSIMLELCRELDITVNDLLNGEIVSPEDYNKKLEKQLLSLMQEKEQSDKLLLRSRYLIVLVVLITYLVICCLSWNLSNGWFVIIYFSFFLVIVLPIALLSNRILQKAGYYRCKKCGHTYVPSFKSVFFAFSWDTQSLYFRCPACKQRAWHIKVLKKD